MFEVQSKMRNYIIGILVVFLVFIGSVIFKQEHTLVFHHFPIPETMKNDSEDIATLYLFLVFSRNDCMTCVLEICDILDTLPPRFRVAGIVPDEELENKSELRQYTSASFPLFGYSEYKKYLTWHTPTLIGVSPTGKVVFMFPGVAGQGQKTYLENFIFTAYGKISSKFNRGGVEKKGGKGQ